MKRAPDFVAILSQKSRRNVANVKYNNIRKGLRFNAVAFSRGHSVAANFSLRSEAKNE